MTELKRVYMGRQRKEQYAHRPVPGVLCAYKRDYHYMGERYAERLAGKDVYGRNPANRHHRVLTAMYAGCNAVKDHALFDDKRLPHKGMEFLWEFIENNKAKAGIMRRRQPMCPMQLNIDYQMRKAGVA